MASIVAFLIVVSATTSLPMRLSIGGISGLAALTVFGVVLLSSAAGHRLAMPWYIIRRLVPLLLLVAWAVVGFIFEGYNTPGAQSLAVLLALILAAVTGARLGRAGPSRAQVVSKALEVGGWVIAALYAASVAVDGLGSEAIMGNRPFSIYALIVLSWTFAASRYRARTSLTALSAVLVVLIVASLGRMAMALTVVIFIVSRMDFRLSRIPKFVGVIAVAAVALWYVIGLEPVQERLFWGDVVEVGGVPINITGRGSMWALAWSSAVTHPWVGQGIGSSELLMRAELTHSNHVHNEYLRFFHDHGIFGLALLLYGLGALGAVCVRALRGRQDESASPYYLAGVLVLITLAGQMLTANPLQYSFVVVPIGCLLGTALGLARLGQRGGIPPGAGAGRLEHVGAPQPSQ